MQKKKKKKGHALSRQKKYIYIDININMEIQFGERVGHGGWLIGPKLSRPKAYPTCVS